MQMNFSHVFLLFIVMAMMSIASGKDLVTLTVYEESSEAGDPFSEEDNEAEADFTLKKIGEMVVDDPYLSLFFRGVFASDITEKGLAHPFVGKPIYLQIQVGLKKNSRLIQLASEKFCNWIIMRRSVNLRSE